MMNKVIVLGFLVCSGINCYALPFTITPKNGTQLPTIVYAASVPAYYTVTNNTQSPRNNNFIKYLPPNVSQVTSGGTYPDTCGALFNLSAAGQAGDSCTLQLSVSGTVDSNDPDPHHHLFACLPSGKSCAGTSFPLNVFHPSLLSIAVTPTTASINALATQQFVATGTYSDGTMQNISSNVGWDSGFGIASISSSGLATGITSGVTTISALLTGISSNTATLTVTAYAYIANTGNNTVRYCQINNNASLSSCQDTGGSPSPFTDPYVVALNPTGTFAYVGAQSVAPITYCTVNSNGSLGSCSTTGTPMSVTGMTFNSAGSFVYITTGNQIDYCQVNSNGTLSSCSITGGDSPIPIPSASGIVLNPAGTFAYAASNSEGKIYYCPVNSNGSLGACSVFTSGLSTPVALAFNFTGSFLYITNGGSTVTYCSIASGGGVGTCDTISGFSNLNNLKGLMFNGAGNYVYLVNGSTGSPSNTVSYCSLNFNGGFVACNTTGTGLDNAFGIAVS